MKLRTTLLTSALMLTVAGMASAQMADTTKPVADMNKPVATTTVALAAATTDIAVSGKVISATSTTLVMDDDAGVRMSFALDPKTTSTTPFVVGDRVNVKYRTLSGGTAYQAASVTVEPQAKVDTQAQVEPKIDDYSTPEQARLPRTASTLPLIGLMGLLAMGGAVGVRIARS